MSFEEDSKSTEAESCDECLERLEIKLLFEGIYCYCGYDFRNYVFSSIRRRIWYRIQTERLSSVSSLQEKVLHDPCMMERLIAVSQFIYPRCLGTQPFLSPSEMAAGIGHEIRNPLTTVRGFLQLLGEREVFQESKEYFELMIEELDRANSIITEFLSLAKDKNVDLKPLSLNSVLEKLFPLIQADALVSNKEISMELQENVVLLLDEKEIRQLILNLARNGLEAMSAGGKLTIRTFMDCEEAILAVGDEGSGIRTEDLDKIGTPFFTTKENGTGLGLTTCFSIAARHNAAIQIESGVGHDLFRAV